MTCSHDGELITGPKFGCIHHELNEKPLLYECEEIERIVSEMTDAEVSALKTTRKILVRDRQHFAGVRFFSGGKP
jgi:hypothetical protein